MSPADQFTYVATSVPTVTAISPTVGSPGGGTKVTISGSSLAGATAVYFGTTAALFTVNSNDQIVATSPPGTVGAVTSR